MGVCTKARAGELCGDKVLVYDLVPLEKKQGAKRTKTVLTINEIEEEEVRFIFNEYANGKGYKAITNTVYIGKVRYNVRQNWSEKRRKNINADPIITDGIHKAIIDEKLWNKVQVILSSNQGKPARIHDGEIPLTGILKCPKCGAGMGISRTTNKLADGTRKRI